MGDWRVDIKRLAGDFLLALGIQMLEVRML
jgi:hypothetical protein